MSLMIKDIFTRNIGMKSLSVLIAVFLWFYVSAVLDPSVDVRVRGVPIIIANSADLKSRNLIITNEIESTIDLSLRGSRSAISRTNNKNVAAFIDVSGYATVGEHQVPIQLNFPFGEISVIKQNHTTIKVDVDALEKRSFPVIAEVVGEPAAGFVASKPVLSINIVMLEGPRSVLKLIDKAQATINIAGASADFTESFAITLLSSNDVVISDPLITMDEENTVATVKVEPQSQQQ